MSTLGDVQYSEGYYLYHEYTGGGGGGGCSVHQRDTMSTPGDIMSTPGDFVTNEKKPLQISRIFVLAPFATM